MESTFSWEQNLMPAWGMMGCCEERTGFEGRQHSANLLGGSIEVYDWIMVACHQQGLKLRELTPDWVEVIGQVFADQRISDKGIMLGIHNDDHNDIVEDGCDYDANRVYLLSSTFGTDVAFKPRLVRDFLERLKAGFETYTGPRNMSAVPVINWRANTTLNQEEIHKLGYPTLCQDIWVTEVFAPVLQEKVSTLGDLFHPVASKLGDVAYLQQVSKLLFTAYLKFIGNTTPIIELK